MDSPFLATMRNPFLALSICYCCVPSVTKYRVGTSKRLDHDILTLNQPIRLQHFERGTENDSSEKRERAIYQIWFV